MKALKDCKWEVEIEIDSMKYLEGDYYYFVAISGENCGYTEKIFSGEKDFKTRVGAINNFKKFAKLNGITNYKIKS